MKQQKRKRRNRWRQYEAEKKTLAAGVIPRAAYEKALQELTKKLKL